MLRRLFAFLLFPALASAEPLLNTKDIPRFRKVADGFYRGGQPNRGGFDFLKQQGVKTVINLRGENDEESTVLALGMKYVHIPMTVTPSTRISDASIQQYFQVMNDPANLPVFIHCQRGADRTGVMVGFYRIAMQGWDGAKAYKEARDIGMHWWYPGLKRQLYDFKPSSKIGLKTFAAPAN